MEGHPMGMIPPFRFVRISRIIIAGILAVMAVMQPPIVLAQTAEIDKTIQELQGKITELQGKENSLSKQINLLNSQISISTLKIDSIRAAIAKLSTEIDELANEIARLEDLMTKRSELVLRRIPESYKRQSTPDFGMLLLATDVSDFILRLKYMNSVQQEDAQLLFQLKATQNNFSERKSLRETKKKQQEDLRLQLEAETKRLEQQKKDKQALLDQTKNSEATYQKLLSQALAERQAVERALVEGNKIGPIKKGDPIALVGNTGYPGCSTGAHLHFEVRKNGGWVNADSYLVSKEVQDAQSGGKHAMGSGSWDWPLEGDVVVTQKYGKTPWSWRYAYSGGIHTGLDMISNTSTVIRAPSDGVLFSSSQSCGSSSIIKIKYIDHGDGVMSFYLHVQ